MTRRLFHRRSCHRRGQPLGLNMPMSGWLALALAGAIAVWTFSKWVMS